MLGDPEDLLGGKKAIIFIFWPQREQTRGLGRQLRETAFDPLPRATGAIGFIDLYDRNPTSTDKTVDVDEVWVSFGTKRGSLEPLPGSSLYALFGKAPKFERQPFRRLESYGLVSTAFNRFPDLQLQVGGSLGRHVYFFGQVSDGTPTFFRDPNALAGDNGTAMPPFPEPTLHSGFPIFYHAEVEDFEIGDDPEWGGGAGVAAGCGS